MPFLLAVVALSLVGFMAFLDTDRAATPADLSPVSFGLPFDWLAQNQGLLNPPRSAFPVSQHLMSPWELHVQVDWFMLVIDVLIVWFVLLAVYEVLRRWRGVTPRTSAGPHR